MKKLIKITLFLFFLILIPFNVNANEFVNIYLFYSETCPHCHDADKAINELIKNRTCQIIIPESLKSDVKLNNTASANIIYDKGF